MAHRGFPRNTSFVTSGGPQGWYEDPFRLHEARYFSDGRPTKLVRDGDTESYDEPPAEIGTASGGSLSRADITGPNPPPAELSANVPGRRRAGVLATVGVVAVAAVVTAVLTVGKPGPATVAMSPAAFVTLSAKHTLAARTADVTVSGSVTGLGESVPISGTGEADFTSNSLALTANFDIQGQSMAEREIEADGNMYMGITVDGQAISQLTGGKHWLKMPVQESQAANFGDGNPASLLAVLEQQGNTVHALGMKVVDGVGCTGYSVTPSKQAMIAAARKAFAGLGLKGGAASSVLQALASMLRPTITVWFDAQGLLREMSVQLSLQMQVGSTNDSADSDVFLDFSNYGAPVKIAVPAASDTISYESFFQSLGASSL